MANANEISDSTKKMNQCFENYILVDVGANLTNRKFSRDLESVITRAKDSGIHPHEAKSWADDSYEELKEIATNCECVAIGECGLDYNKNFSPPEIQRLVFKQQVQLACQLHKPLCIHERDAHEDVLMILDEFKGSLPPVILYSYTGSSTQAQKYLQLGLYLCVTGFLTKDNSDNGIQALLEQGAISLDQLLVQTDSPFMYPNSRASKLPEKVKCALTHRSLSFLQRYCTFQRNEPCSLPAIVEMIAAFVNKSPEDIALATSFNALKLFGLS